MNNDIKELQLKTGLSMSEIKAAYEFCNQNKLVTKKYLEYIYEPIARYKIIDGVKFPYTKEDYLELARKTKYGVLRDYVIGEDIYFYDKNGTKLNPFDYDGDTPIFDIEKDKHFEHILYVFLDVEVKEFNKDISVLQTKQMICNIIENTEDSKISISKNLLEVIYSQLQRLEEYEELGTVGEFSYLRELSDFYKEPDYETI